MNTGILDLPYTSLIRIGKDQKAGGKQGDSPPPLLSLPYDVLEHVSTSAERDARRYVRRFLQV